MLDWKSIPIESEDDDSSNENNIIIQDKNSELNATPVCEKNLIYTPGGITTSNLGSSSLGLTNIALPSPMGD